jgi:anti-sigma B factor antagonist
MLRHFELRHREHGYASSLHVEGELDLASASRFRQLISDLMGSGIRVVMVDLSDAPFVDSTGLGALLWADRRLRAVGGQLGVVRAQEQVVKTFELAGLEDMLLH